jgi:hypothetical protein
MSSSTFEVVLTIFLMSFWFLFPIGMFLSVSNVDTNTDQIIRLGHHEHNQEEEVEEVEENQNVFRPIPFDWHHPIIFFRRWLEHE